MPRFGTTPLGTEQIVRLLRHLANVVESNELFCYEQNIHVRLPGSGNDIPAVDNNSYLRTNKDRLNGYDMWSDFHFKIKDIPTEENHHGYDPNSLVKKLDIQNVLFPKENIITKEHIKESSDFIKELERVGTKACMAGTRLKEDTLKSHWNIVPKKTIEDYAKFDYGSIEQRVIANFVSQVEQAVASKKADPYYKLTNEERTAIVICSGANFTTKRIQDSVIYDIEDVSVQWDGEKFLVAQKQKASNDS